MNLITTYSSKPARAVTVLRIDGTARQLEISTSKDFTGVLVSRAACVSVNDGFRTFIVHGDFSRCLIRSKGRATDAAVRAQHEAALLQLPVTLEDVKAFYVAKDASVSSPESAASLRSSQ